MMKFEKARKYLVSPLHMEPQRCGEFGIEVVDHPPGYKETAVSMRTALMSGAPVRTITHPNGVRRHHLVQYEGDKKGTLMSDIAQEMIDFAEVIQGMQRLKPCKVLIGGLGLGYVAHWAARFHHDVTVVENEPDIIRLTGKYLPANVHVIHADLHEFVPATNVKRFRLAVFDTWYGQSEGTYWGNVVPLRRAWAKAGADPRRLWCWKEQDEMWPQVYRSTLEMAKRFRGQPPATHWPPHRVFLQVLNDHFAHLDNEGVEMLALHYTRCLADGRLPAQHWEMHWGAGWDAIAKEAEAHYGAEKGGVTK